ncbi:tubulin-tyrosine ligase family-domain-containing protein [Triangularia verruculosa]|uniref:Tubulin-tyrosine ligase family-domain-containing protein n=1 Tax=Triangularia verruculosa TaxID=2587418 RepID=A0AAN7ATB6_9PEZI|nr:tubulin-tyrosine ligase family-domain-containing protein [Triangularia verruculosa]
MHVFINGSSRWLNPHLRKYILDYVPDAIFYDSFEDFPEGPLEESFQFLDGWEIGGNFAIINNSKNGLINAYPSSDALARKDYLARVVDFWRAKRPQSKLPDHVPITVRLSLDYAEFVDESLTAADDLSLLYSLEQNEDREPKERDWWILKPALIDCGAGIRIFSTVEELASHLELAEYEYTDDDEEEEEEEKEEEGAVAEKEKNGVSLSLPALNSLDALVTTVSGLGLDDKKAQAEGRGDQKRVQYVFKKDGRIPSAQMREFVAQQYIVRIPPVEGKKWHVRAYVLAMGRLKVHVFRELLALLACEDYQPPWENPSLRSSLTNTALQDEDEFVSNESMRDFWSDAVPEKLLADGWKESVWDQICDVTAELFKAAAHTMADKFNTVNKSFELFAADFLVDDNGRVWLLEVNETPAFYNHDKAGELALRLMESVIFAAMEHMGKAQAADDKLEAIRDRFVKVLDETENLPKSKIVEINCD